MVQNIESVAFKERRIKMSKNDVAIKELMKKVEEQKLILGNKERVSWLTNGVFTWDNGNFFNINTVMDKIVLATALGFLISQEDAFKKACSMLGVDGEYKWHGCSVNEWKEDFITRIRIIDFDKKKKTLDATKAKLSSLVSEEARTKMELEDIKKILES
jgi:hypothetical protein